MKGFLKAILKIVLLLLLTVLTLGFGLVGLCATLLNHGQNAGEGVILLALALIGAVLFGKLLSSLWRQIKGPRP